MNRTAQSYQYQLPVFRYAGYGAMATLLILAILFYQERAFFSDIAFQTFLMINEGSVQIMVNRFGAALIQLLPLLAIKAEAPLWLISMSYSASFPLLFLAIYWLIVRFFKNDYLGWVLVFLFTLIVFDAFYWATSEQQQGLAVLLLFFAYLLRYPGRFSWWMWIINVLAVVVLAYYHPLIFIPFYFLWLYFILHEPGRFFNKQFLLIGAIMLMVLIVKSQLSSNWYDADKINTFTTNLKAYYPNYLSMPSHFQFLENCLKVWYFFPLFLIIDIAYYAVQKAWLKLVLLISFCLGFIFLLHIAFPNTEHRFYAEVNYMALSIFVMVPFVFEIAPLIKAKYLALIFLSILIIRLSSIAYNHRPYTQRVEWIAAQLDQAITDGDKFYLDKKEAPMDVLLMEWGLPYESLIISNIQGQPQTLFIHSDIQSFQEELQQDSTFITSFKIYHQKELNVKYFYLRPGTYKALVD
jgi:hypothetical protein